MDLVRAAGGVVWREGPGGPRLALVHRPHRDDWSLPKGKLGSGESWHGAALREIAEETGCDARITRFAGAKLLVDRPVPKLVLYWHMRLVRQGELEEGDEVDEVAWLPPREALSRLDHASDRRLLLRALSGGAWRRGPGRTGRGAVPVPGRETLRKLLVLDSRCPEDEIARFLRLVERTAEGERRRGTG
jgi:ADP-ribose pyrophosphatase YjhB (NUDIX family)